MIKEKRKWLTYTYFNRNPKFLLKTVHLFSPVKKTIPGMICIPFPTMIINLKNENFIESWSKSAKYKINRAEKENLNLKRGLEYLPEILTLFQKTAEVKKLRGFRIGDFDSKPWIQCSAIFFEGKILAGHVWLIDPEEKRALLYVNASDHHEDQNDSSLIGRAHYYLLWQDGLYFQMEGIEIMDLDGYKPETNDPALKGVYIWKEATHGQEEILYQYYPLYIHWLRKFRNMAAR
ncbi:MAG: hypothetical protein IPP15_09815 [Saprospiraceae bacterium]|uniref:Uncharacterized protein n=1 Tax=Candidatus Opimibacter skivensis TaxID=2982028 RepID=A0A9D7SVK0_9BACT|nr:hypothetical protein [Candidatus Opimibacter skivensis]